MQNWLRVTGRAVGVGLAWAAVWAPVAVAVGLLIIDPDNSLDEMWFVIGAYPGFVCGVLFMVLLGVFARGARLAEQPLPMLAGLGAAAGVVVGVFPFLVGTPTDAVPVWVLASAVIGSITLMSALSAVASALVVRAVRRRGLPRAQESGT